MCNCLLERQTVDFCIYQDSVLKTTCLEKPPDLINLFNLIYIFNSTNKQHLVNNIHFCGYFDNIQTCWPEVEGVTLELLLEIDATKICHE